MPLLKARYAAVDIIDDEFVYLQLCNKDGAVAVYEYFQQPITAAQRTSFACAGLMTTLENQSLYYQQIKKTASAASIHHRVHESLNADNRYQAAELAVDFQPVGPDIHVVSAQTSQVKKRQQQFAAYSPAMLIVEPAFQAIIRATNFWLSQSSVLVTAAHASWLIIELNAPIGVCFFCHYGAISNVKFMSENELYDVISAAPLFFFYGNPEPYSASLCALLSRGHQIVVESLLDQPLPVTHSIRSLCLLGNALRGFSHWHH